MSASTDSGRRSRPASPAPIGPGPAIAAWAVGWVVGTVLVAPILITAMGADIGTDLTIPQLAVAVAGGWLVFMVAAASVSRRAGTGGFAGDLGLAFAPVDVVGIPLGIATQLAVVPALYVPLRSRWPETFSDERIEQRAQDLADSAGGWLTVLLVLVVVVGAPIVEEIVYRGLLQRSLSRTLGRLVGLLVASLWFSLIHLSPVEYPGLFLAGLVFGGCVVVTGRIGPAIVTHAAFNATGLFLVLRTAT